MNRFWTALAYIENFLMKARARRARLEDAISANPRLAWVSFVVIWGVTVYLMRG